MSALKESIIVKLDALPEPALHRVLDFVSYLAVHGGEGESSLLAVAGKLSGEPMSAHEIEESLYGKNGRGQR